MGTRNSTLVKINNQFVVAQYGQWDGYPEGQGQTILETLRGCDLQELREKCLGLTEVTDAEVDASWKEAEAKVKREAEGNYSSLKVEKAFQEKSLHLSRDCGGKILECILKGAKKVSLNVDFAFNDTVFCEWAYIVDFDKNTFETYEGTATPANLLVSYDLGSLPEVDVFIEDCRVKQGKGD